MNNQNIKLDDGYEIEVIALDVRRTYGEFLFGSPNKEDNIQMFKNLKVPEHWGKRKLVYINKSFELGFDGFKKYIVYVWFSSNKSINDPERKFDGSEVVMVMNIDDISNFSISVLIENKGLKKFDWGKNAENVFI
jgi:hypothetical protein